MNRDLNLIFMTNIDKILQAKVVEETRSFTNAAQRLKTSQPALSRSIKKLEDDIGFKLFLRTTAGVKPTPEATAIFQMAGEIVGFIQNLTIQLSKSRDDETNPLHLGTKEPFAIHVWPRFLTWLKTQNRPDILDTAIRAEIYIDKSNIHLEEQFRLRKLDTLLILEPAKNQKGEKYELFETRHRLYSAVPTSQSAVVTVRERCFVYKNALVRDGKTLMDYIPKDSGLRFSPVQSFDAAVALSSAGLGLAILPSWIADNSVKNKLLHEVRSNLGSVIAKVPNPTVYFCIQNDAGKKTISLARYLRRFCREHYANP